MKDKNICIRCTEEEREAVNKFAFERGLKTSDFIWAQIEKAMRETPHWEHIEDDVLIKSGQQVIVWRCSLCGHKVYLKPGVKPADFCTNCKERLI